MSGHNAVTVAGVPAARRRLHRRDDDTRDDGTGDSDRAEVPSGRRRGADLAVLRQKTTTDRWLSSARYRSREITTLPEKNPIEVGSKILSDRIVLLAHKFQITLPEMSKRLPIFPRIVFHQFLPYKYIMLHSLATKHDCILVTYF